MDGYKWVLEPAIETGFEPVTDTVVTVAYSLADELKGVFRKAVAWLANRNRS